MKKNLLAGLTGTFLMLVTCIAVNGQIASDNIQPSGYFDPFEKTISISTPVARQDVNSRAVRNFGRSYKNVVGETWFKSPQGFVSLFDLDDIGYQVVYAKKGTWVYTIRSYGEANLPEDIRHLVKSVYYDCTINLVQEIETPVDPLAYIIQLKGKTQIISLRFCDGEMNVFKKYNRSE